MITHEWLQWIDHPILSHELTQLCSCINRQQPFGTAELASHCCQSWGRSHRGKRDRPRNR